MTVGAWFSEGLLAIFFLLVGLEIQHGMTVGDGSDPRAAVLPAVAAIGGVLAPAAIYLAVAARPHAAGQYRRPPTSLSPSASWHFWDRAFPLALRVFIAALAVVDDVLSVLTLAIFYPKTFGAEWLLASGLAVAVLLALNRWRVYATWPYLVVAVVLWVSLPLPAGVHGALAGIFLAAFLPTRPARRRAGSWRKRPPHWRHWNMPRSWCWWRGWWRVRRRTGSDASAIAQEPVWDWASRNLSAASERLLSPADRIERAVAPWSTYAILPLFAFSATGVSFNLDLSAPDAWRIPLGVILGLVIGKPLGIFVASLLATRSELERGPADVTVRNFIGAACLCGAGYTVSLLMAEQAFPPGPEAALAKTGVLIS